MGLFFKSSTTSQDDDEEIKGAVGNVEELVPVQAVFDNMMVLKDGSFRMVLKTTALNFDLKSSREQVLLLNTFGTVLNILTPDFPIQILLHSSHLDTSRYTDRYKERLKDPSLSPFLRDVIEEHIDFFQFQATNNYLLDRSFYLVVPFFIGNQVALADSGVATEMPGGGFLKGMLDGSNREKEKEVKEQNLERAKIQLMNRSSILIAQLSRLNIEAEVLDQLSLVQLLRELYNPGISERQKLRNIDNLDSLIVSPRDRTRDQMRQNRTNTGGRF